MKKELSDLGGFLAGVLPEQHQPEAERLVNKLREAVELYVRELGGEHNRGSESSEGRSSQASQAGRLPGVQPSVPIGGVLTVQAERKDGDLNGKLAEASAGVRGDLSKDDGGVAQDAALGSLKRYTKQWVWLKGEPMPWRADAVMVDQFDRLQRVVWNYPPMDNWDRASKPFGYQGYRIMPNLFLCRGVDVMWASVRDARRAMEGEEWNDLPGQLFHSGDERALAEPDELPWEDVPSVVRQHGWIILEGSIWPDTPRKAIVEFSKEGHLVKFHFLAHAMGFWWVLQQGEKGPELAITGLVSGMVDTPPLPFIGYRFLEGRADTHPDDVKILMHGMDVKEAPEWKEEV